MGRAAGVPRGPGSPSWVAVTGPRLVRGLRERVDALPRGGDRLGPRPGGLDFQASPPSAAGQPGGSVQQPVAQRPGLGPGQVTVQGQQLEPGQQDLPGHRRGQPGRVDREVMGGSGPGRRPRQCGWRPRSGRGRGGRRRCRRPGPARRWWRAGGLVTHREWLPESEPVADRVMDTPPRLRRLSWLPPHPRGQMPGLALGTPCLHGGVTSEPGFRPCSSGRISASRAPGPNPRLDDADFACSVSPGTLLFGGRPWCSHEGVAAVAREPPQVPVRAPRRP